MNRWSGQQIGKYEIKEMVGRGGTGEVYKAYHAALERDVAIKTIHTYSDEPKAIERFRREARIIAALRHPHIVQVHDFDIADGSFYMVMEYVAGQSLQEYLKPIHARHETIPLPEALTLFQTVCRAVAYAHSQGVVHADLKPANVLLTTDSKPILADFGLSRLAGRERVTSSNALTGTPAYMSPEQCMSKGSDERSDIYSLGIMLFELTTGSLPFTADSIVAIILKHIDEPPPFPRTFNPAIPLQLEDIILQALEKDPGKRFQTVSEMLQALDSVIVPLGGVPSMMFEDDDPLPDDIEPCYRGLQPFEEEHAPFYFGREALVRQMVQRIEQMVKKEEGSSNGRFLALLGASGSGKSSLIRAGLIPQLRAGAVPNSHNWQIRLLKPGQRPLTALTNTLHTLVADQLLTTTGLAQQLQKDGRSLSRIFQETRPGEQLCLIIDQFEEIFTLCHDEQERRQFIENLLYAAAVNDGPILVLLTMRADFYHRCASYRDLATRIASQQMLVGSMNQAELRQAIAQPAQQAGLRFEPGLVETILHDVAQQPGALPLLQHALLELWHRRQGRLLSLRAYHASGGVQGAIAQRADAVYDSLAESDRPILRRIMLRLTELGNEGGQATSRRATPTEFLARNIGMERINTVLRTLADARLVILGDDTVEVAHEALIRSWPALQEWLEEDREGLRIHQHLGNAAQAWAAMDQDAGELYRGLRLARAAAWAADHDDELNAVERDFLHRSQQQAAQREQEEETRRQRELAQAQELVEAERQRAEIQTRSNRQLRWSLLGVGVLLLAAVGALLFAYNQQQTVNARRLAFAAEAQLETSPETAVLLAYEAINRRHDFQSEQALRDALQRFTWRSMPLAHDGPVLKATYSPNGERLLTVSEDGTAKLWSKDGLLLETLTGHEDAVVDGRFNQSGTQFVTASADGTARLWDANGNPIATLTGHEDALIAALFTPDEQQILTAAADGTARLWDLTGQQQTLFDGHGGEELTAVALNPAGTQIITGDKAGTAVLWQNDGSQTATLAGHSEEITVVAFSPDGQHLLTGGEDFVAIVWDAAGQEQTRLEHNEVISAAVFRPDSQAVLVAAGRENSIRMWALNGFPLNTFYGHTRRVESIQFSADGERLLTSSDDGTVRLWTLAGQHVATLRDHTLNVGYAEFSPDGQQVLSASSDNTARIWEPIAQPAPPLFGHTDEVEHAVYSFNGQYALTASTDQTARLWDVKGNTLTIFTGHEEQVNTAFFSPDQQFVVTTSEDGTARLWDLNGRLLATFNHEDEVGSAVFSPDGQFVLTASDDKTARLWRLNGDLVTTFAGHEDEVDAAVFSPDGQLVLTASEDATARLWDLEGAQLMVFQHEDQLKMAAFSAGGELVLTASEDNTAGLWNLSGERLATLAGHGDDLETAVFSPDGQMVATTSKDRTAKLWDLEGNEVATLTGHTNIIKWAAFSPDSQRVATASDDGTVRLWNLEGEQLAIFRDHENWVATAVFSADGTRIITASRDFTARQFVLNVEDLLQTAVCQVSRTLTPEEIERFQVGTPTLDIESRSCPPVYSWMP